MTGFYLLAAASADATGFSPLRLFLDADIVVKLVILGLLAASLWVWATIIAFSTRMRSIRRRTAEFEHGFGASQDIDAFAKSRASEALPIAAVLNAGVGEWRHSTTQRQIDRDGTRERLMTAMNAAIAEQVHSLAHRLNFLATVGSVGPFVGLFGTVWGIMRSFTAIAGAKTSSLAVVAPGIAEALFATAIGLFAAIPAVIAYNRFAHAVNGHEARLGRFADGFHAMLSRELERA